MKIEQSCAFAAAYALSVFAMVQLNVTLLGLGDYKFGNGHGGWEIYFPIWLLAFLPCAIFGSVAIAGTRASGRAAWTLVAVFSLMLIAALEICFVTDAHYLVVIGVNVLLGALFFGLSQMAGRQVNTGQPQSPAARGQLR